MKIILIVVLTIFFYNFVQASTNEETKITPDTKVEGCILLGFSLEVIDTNTVFGLLTKLTNNSRPVIIRLIGKATTPDGKFIDMNNIILLGKAEYNLGAKRVKIYLDNMIYSSNNFNQKISATVTDNDGTNGLLIPFITTNYLVLQAEKNKLTYYGFEIPKDKKIMVIFQ